MDIDIHIDRHVDVYEDLYIELQSRLSGKPRGFYIRTCVEVIMHNMALLSLTLKAAHILKIHIILYVCVSTHNMHTVTDFHNHAK